MNSEQLSTVAPLRIASSDVPSDAETAAERKIVTAGVARPTARRVARPGGAARTGSSPTSGPYSCASRR